MFIQQPVRIRVEPKAAQAANVSLEPLVRAHYEAKAQNMQSDVVRVLRLDTMNPTISGSATQLDLFISVEADTITFFNQYMRSFVQYEETDDLILSPVS